MRRVITVPFIRECAGPRPDVGPIAYECVDGLEVELPQRLATYEHVVCGKTH